MAKIVMYKTRYCGYCTAAARFLKEVKKQELEIIDLSNDHEKRMQLMRETGHRTVPMIFINDAFIGGYDDLRALEREGRLDPMLASTKD